MTVRASVLSLVIAAVPLLTAAPQAIAAETYAIDIKGQHAFIEFRIKHLGYSWLYGRFNEFDGEFVVDRDDPTRSRVTVDIATASIDTNHAERDKHLRSNDFLSVDRHPKARFVSTAVETTGETTGIIKGDLTLNGVTRPVDLTVEEIGHGPDPWGGYRAGFSGSTSIKRSDFGISYDLGPAAESMQFDITIEGVRK